MTGEDSLNEKDNKNKCNQIIQTPLRLQEGI